MSVKTSDASLLLYAAFGHCRPLERLSVCASCVCLCTIEYVRTYIEVFAKAEATHRHSKLWTTYVRSYNSSLRPYPGVAYVRTYFVLE